MKRAVALAALAAALAVALPVQAASLSSTLTGRFGALGTVTLRSYTDGTGSLVVNLHGLRAEGTYPVALVRGRCPGAVVRAMPTLTATLTGRLGRTLKVAAVPSARPLGVRVGTLCRTLLAPAVPTPSPAATASPTATASRSPCTGGVLCFGAMTTITVGDRRGIIAPTGVTRDVNPGGALVRVAMKGSLEGGGFGYADLQAMAPILNSRASIVGAVPEEAASWNNLAETGEFWFQVSSVMEQSYWLGVRDNDGAFLWWLLVKP